MAATRLTQPHLMITTQKWHMAQQNGRDHEPLRDGRDGWGEWGGVGGMDGRAGGLADWHRPAGTAWAGRHRFGGRVPLGRAG
jgi:hypothetical protein